MKRRGQVQLSFGMIFSIFIIIATVAVAFFFIRSFLGTGECVQLNVFNENLQEDIDKIWRSPEAQQLFVGQVSTGIERVCFGDLEAAGSSYAEEYRDLRRYQGEGVNLFFFPSSSACDGSLAGRKLDHVEDGGFFCKNVENGEVKLKLIKESSREDLVRVEA